MDSWGEIDGPGRPPVLYTREGIVSSCLRQVMLEACEHLRSQLLSFRAWKVGRVRTSSKLTLSGYVSPMQPSR